MRPTRVFADFDARSRTRTFVAEADEQVQCCPRPRWARHADSGVEPQTTLWARVSTLLRGFRCRKARCACTHAICAASFRLSSRAPRMPRSTTVPAPDGHGDRPASQVRAAAPLPLRHQGPIALSCTSRVVRADRSDPHAAPAVQGATFAAAVRQALGHACRAACRLFHACSAAPLACGECNVARLSSWRSERAALLSLQRG